MLLNYNKKKKKEIHGIEKSKIGLKLDEFRGGHGPRNTANLPGRRKYRERKSTHACL